MQQHWPWLLGSIYSRDAYAPSIGHYTTSHYCLPRLLCSIFSCGFYASLRNVDLMQLHHLWYTHNIVGHCLYTLSLRLQLLQSITGCDFYSPPSDATQHHQPMVVPMLHDQLSAVAFACNHRLWHLCIIIGHSNGSYTAYSWNLLKKDKIVVSPILH